MEKVIEIKSCKHCDTKFEITDKDLEFYKKVSPVFNGKKYTIPSPNLCPECRFINRDLFINERNLYKRKCDLTGKDVISNYSPDKVHKVYESDKWLSSNDFTKYAKEFDFNRPFFEQFNELFLEVPRMSLDKGANIESSSYNNYVDDLKDCYMCFNCIGGESCYYCSYSFGSNKCLDCFISNDNIECYELISSKKCYNSYFIQNSTLCNDSIFLKECNNCKDCLYCVNLVGKQYCIFNKQYLKEEYEVMKKEILSDINIDTSKCKIKFNEFKEGNIVKNLNILNSENSSGDDILNSKNIKNCYLVNNSENISYSFNSSEAKDCHDCDGFKIERSYYTVITGGASTKCLFCIAGWENCSDLIYSDYCFFNCSNLFGCTGLKNKSYCILNKQYTKEEYNILVPKIIEHMKKTEEWGEFFPSSISPFGYNETVAQEYFPLSPPLSSGHLPLAGEKTTNPPPAREGLGEGLRFNWSTYTPPLPKVSKSIPADKLPQNISDIPDDILNWAIECEVTNKPFKIIKPELEFYRKHNLPIPKRHPDQRHLDRMKLRNPRKLFDRDCDKCGISMKTTYSPERREIVYCEKCYNKEIY